VNPAELGELKAFRDLFAAGPAGAHVKEVGHAVCTALESTPRSAMFNRALGLGLSGAATDADLDAVLEFFGNLGVEYAVPLAPEARPRDLAERLERRGLAPGYAWAKFIRSADGAPTFETDLRVERVGADRSADFARVFVRAYGTPTLFEPWVARLPGRPGWHCFVAYAGGEPAATGALFVTGAVGWLGLAGTLPEHRRRGAQNAILSARIRAAAEAGCEVVTTETGALEGARPSNSYRNIERSGFEFAYVRPNYLSAPEADTSGTSV
jgi:GNAT superfamily N-acetyltransferase